MASITQLQGTDGVTTANSMTKINTNFASLNSDKIETSYLDTDTSLTANSDTKIATQKAVKAYVDSGGQQNASETIRGLVQEATDAQVTAGTATGSTGAKLFVTPAKYKTNLDTRVSAFTFLKGVKAGISSHDMATSGGQTIAHGLGVVPILIKITAYGVFSNRNYAITSSIGFYDGATNSYMSYSAVEGASSKVNDTTTSGTGSIIYLLDSDAVYAAASFDSTNITLNWSVTNNPTGTVQIAWEAYS